MENQIINEKPVPIVEYRFIENHSILNVVFVLNIISFAAISFYLPSILTTLRSQTWHRTIVYISLAVYTLIMNGIAFLIRCKLISKKKMLAASLTNLTIGFFGLSPFQFAIGICLGFANFYQKIVDYKDDETYAYYENILDNLYRKKDSGELSTFDLVKQKSKYTGEIEHIKTRLQSEKRSATLERQKEITDLIKKYDSLMIHPSYQENIIYTYEELLEKSKDLTEDKLKIFLKHKEYYDSGIYSKDEFVKKTSVLFK